KEWHHLRGYQLRHRTGTVRWPTDCSAQGSTAHGRLSETGHGACFGCVFSGAATSSHQGTVCSSAIGLRAKACEPVLSIFSGLKCITQEPQYPLPANYNGYTEHLVPNETLWSGHLPGLWKERFSY